jgi:cytosine/uracil/thiamine/allantoin permease
MLKDILKLLGIGLVGLIVFWFFGEVFAARGVFYIPTLLKFTGWAILFIMGGMAFFLYQRNKKQQRLQEAEVKVPEEQSDSIKSSGS